MSRFIDLTGKRFSRLLVLRRLKNNQFGRSYWECLCDCGNYHNVSGNVLIRGASKSCGCYNLECVSKRSFVDISQKRFNRWKVLKFKKMNNQQQAIWICQCDCGTIRNVLGISLRCGNSKSCGCLHKELTSKHNLIDLTNKRFGKLVVLSKEFEKSNTGDVKWKCKCDCGKEIVTRGCFLRRGVSRGCGCSRIPFLRMIMSSNQYKEKLRMSSGYRWMKQRGELLT